MFVILAGCESTPDDVVTPDGTVVQARLKSAHWLYNTFHAKRQKSPENAAQLQQFGLELPTAEGGPVSLTDPFLTSARDKKVIAVRYGLDLSKATPQTILAHEQDGFKGRRFVVYALSGTIEEVDEAIFQDGVK